MIFKVQGSKCIFCETYSMSSMFDPFFMLVPLLSISSFHKKSKLIGLQLGLNR